MILKTSLFCTTASIDPGTGGGNVCRHEMLALKSATNLKLVLDRKRIAPGIYGQPDSPFLYDYFASELIPESGIDIAHFNGNPFRLCVKKLHSQGSKIVVSVPAHNLELSIDERQRLNIEYPHRHMTDPFLWCLYTEHIREADTVVCPSFRSAEYITAKLGLRNDVRVIPHGTDLPKRVKPFPDGFKVGHVSVVGADKGQIYLVKAWDSLKLPDARLILAGLGTENWGGLGYVKNPQVVYDSCHVYVQPSVTEAFGLPVLEAMVAGRPVIVTAEVGAAELIKEGYEGFIVPIRDPASIANRITYFHENPKEIGRMGRNARKKAEKYSWKRVRKQYEQLYASI